MSRILLTWELGLGLGHLMRLRPIALELAARGHELLLAARDLSKVRNVFGECKISYLPAPCCSYRSGNVDLLVTYADLLANVGFGDRSLLAAHVEAWRNLFTLTQPNLMVCDHSPTALLSGA